MPGKVVRLFAIAMLIAAALWLVKRVALDRYHASVALRRAENAITLLFNLPDSGGRNQIARSQLHALSAFPQSIPEAASVDMVRAADFRILDRNEDAERAYEEALQWGGRPEIYLNIAAVQVSLNKRERALDTLTKVLLFNPYMLADSEDPTMRDDALRRFAARATPRARGDVYLNLAIAYLAAGYPRAAADAITSGALADPSVLTRPELMRWGDMYVRDALNGYARARGRQPRMLDSWNLPSQPK